MEYLPTCCFKLWQNVGKYFIHGRYGIVTVYHFQIADTPKARNTSKKGILRGLTTRFCAPIIWNYPVARIPVYGQFPFLGSGILNFSAFICEWHPGARVVDPTYHLQVPDSHGQLMFSINPSCYTRACRQ